ncbi:MAG: CDP-alcohol phosphatidyltransferase family protein [Oscillospiraceae bacterium]
MTIPNLLSFFRIFLIPVFVLTFIFSEADGVSWWPITVLVISGLTDLLDGFIARRYNQITKLGIMLDPIADKLTQVVVCACLTVRYNQLLILLIIYVIKELVMLSGGLILIKSHREVPAAKWYGKISTFELYVAMGLFLIIPQMNPIIINIIILITVVFVLFALAMYMFKFFELLNKKGENK